MLLVRFLTNSDQIFAQNSQIREKQIPLVTYSYSDPDPVPEIGKFYPFYRFNGYSDKGVMQNWKMVEMENDYIKLWIAPQIGGKIWGAIEKKTGKEFIYYNHTVKFRDVAMRGPWTSGGLELNFGIIGHAPTCSSPVDYMVRENEDGGVSCFVGAIDLPSRTRWSVEINLSKDKAYFTTRSFWDNPSRLEQSYYHWMNLGIKTTGNLEYCFPGNYYLGHDGKPSAWPVDEQGRKINFYENNNFGSYKSYHVFGEATGFYGAYWHTDDFGFVHYSTFDDKPGKKVWIWGLSDQGMIWDKLLTDSDGQYTEIQSGRLFNQPASESSYTPFKNRGFPAGSTDEWTEYWFPVKETKGLKSALPVGSVNIEQHGDTIKLWFCPNEKTDGQLEVRSGSEIVYAKEIHLNPMQVLTNSFESKASNKNLSVWLKNDLLFETNREKYLLKRPVQSPDSFNWESLYGHFTKGKEQERQREYKTAAQEYKKAIALEPWFVPALTGMANLAYRETNYTISMEFASKALRVDTYDADANMIYGLAGLAMGDTTSAIDGFSVASAGLSQRCAAYNALATVSLCKKEFQRALHYSEKSLVYNFLGSDGIELKLLSLRKLGMIEKEENELSNLELKDPLNHFIRFERFLIDPSSENKIQVQSHITNELPHETYLEYALWYFRNGQLSDAMKVLELAANDQPIVLIWKAYLDHLDGKEDIAKATIVKALEAKPDFVFPFRTESLKPLEWAGSHWDNWKIKYYTALIYLCAGNEEKGLDLLKSCADKPDFYPFYILRSRIYNSDSQQPQVDAKRALALGGSDWRVGLFASGFFMGKGNLPEAEELASDFYKKNPQNYILGLHFAKILEMRQKYSLCVGLLQKIQVLPNEGATDGRTLWRNANLGNALDMLKGRKYKQALRFIENARQWPENLGVGKPYSVDERLEDFFALLCYKKLNDRQSESEMENRIAGKAIQQKLSLDENDFLTAWLLKESGNKSEGDRVMNQLARKDSVSQNIRWCQAVYSGELESAGNIQKKIIDSERFAFFLNQIFNDPRIIASHDNAQKPMKVLMK
jgi:tetratricopeptide (TPR) repeat protein